jgi:hypothetical protein
MAAIVEAGSPPASGHHHECNCDDDQQPEEGGDLGRAVQPWQALRASQQVVQAGEEVAAVGRIRGQGEVPTGTQPEDRIDDHAIEH